MSSIIVEIHNQEKAQVPFLCDRSEIEGLACREEDLKKIVPLNLLRIDLPCILTKYCTWVGLHQSVGNSVVDRGVA